MIRMFFDGFARDYAAGGWVMVPLVLLGGVGTLGGVCSVVITLTLAKARTLWCAGGLMAFGAIAPILGVLGYFLGLSQMESALEHVSPEVRDKLRLAGTSEALTCVEYGLGAGLLPFCLGLALVGIGLARR